MGENERDFKGVWIPKEVWLDTRLNALDKIILAEIDSLGSGERGCWASNKYIAEFCQCSESKVSKAISKLIEYGYLVLKSFDGRQRELRSSLTNGASLLSKIYKADGQNLQDSKADYAKQQSKKSKAAEQKMPESNIVNNTVNNTENKKKERKKDSFDKILAAYTDDEETLKLLGEWLRVRKAKRAAMTDTAIQMNVDKLDKLAEESGLSVKQYLSEIICRGWAAFYVIKNYNNQQQNGSSYGEQLQTINGKEYIYKNGKYYIPNGSGVAVNPFAKDDLPF